MTRLLRVCIGTITLPALLALSASAARNKGLEVNFKTSQGQDAGTATLTPAGNGVKVKLNLTNLPEGEHALHVHQNAKCEGPDFKTAGGHFNPADKKHGRDNPAGPHNGDLPNIEVGPDGKATTSLLDTNVTLSDGPNSLFHDGGTSIVIHAMQDDYKTDPAGNSGARIACGVIQK